MTFWKVYFGDKSIFSAYDGTPFSIEQLNSGVQVIAQTDKKHGYHTISGHTYYMWDCRGNDEEPRWYGGDFAGLTFYLRRPGFKRVLIGEEIDNERFDEIAGMLLRDPDFPEKTGYGSKERKP